MLQTYVGDILVAVNPFQPLSIYGPEIAALYFKAVRSDVDPHLFALADGAYHGMVNNQMAQAGR